MNYEEETTELRAKVRELEAELADCRRLLGGGLTDADWLDLICERYGLVPEARVAELEAQVAQEKQLAEAAWRGHADVTARAEKAERSEEQYRVAYEQQTENAKDWESTAKAYEELRQRLEARVAELRELLIGAHVGGPEWERKVADAIYGQAREREA